ncbi:MAG: BrnT family toxin [Candidatus Sulfotelmatobacter sp.]
MRFEWDEAKSRRNLLKHNVRFETAALAFDDPYALTQRDESPDEEERWITLGSLGLDAVLFVVHTMRRRGEEEVIRIISARNATPRERRTYEEAHQGAKKRHRRYPGHERRRH